MLNLFNRNTICVKHIISILQEHWCFEKKYYIVLWCGICQCKRHSHLGGCLRTIALMHWILFFEVNFAY